MDFGPLSYPLLGRCRGVVQVERVRDADYVKIDGRKMEFKEPGTSRAVPPPQITPDLQSLYVAALPHAFATHAGSHITRDSFLIEEFSRHLNDPIAEHKRLHSLQPLRRIKKVRGTVVSLAAPCQHNYYHWMLEVLPKLALFRHHRNMPDDAVYYMEMDRPFQVESLRLLGFDPKSLINSSRAKIVQADNLWAATSPAPSGAPHPWAASWIQKNLSALVRDASDAPMLPCVVISRRKATKRKILDEEKLVDALATFHPVTAILEEMTLAEQAALFHRARVIIAPHGAGLTNMLFARPDCHVFEIFLDNYRNPVFQELAKLVGCRHTAHYGKPVPDPMNGEMNIQINVPAFMDVVWNGIGT